jgi:hypothetical protein
MATYYRRTGAERRVDEHGDWGRASYLFEVHGRRVLRQIEIYESGSMVRYGPDRRSDGYGSLFSTLPEASAIDANPLPQSIFNSAWYDGATHVRLGADARRVFRDEYRVAAVGEFPGLEEALTYVQSDLDATMANAPILRLVIEPAGSLEPDDPSFGAPVRIGLADGRRDGPLLQPEYYAVGQGPSEHVADAAQDTIMGLGGWFWPACPDHGNGLHASRPFSESEGVSWQDSPEPVWLCRGGDVVHVVSRIGELDGGQRRRNRRTTKVSRPRG